jgi:hypothetical protein
MGSRPCAFRAFPCNDSRVLWEHVVEADALPFPIEIDGTMERVHPLRALAKGSDAIGSQAALSPGKSPTRPRLQLRSSRSTPLVQETAMAWSAVARCLVPLRQAGDRFGEQRHALAGRLP